MFTILVVDDEPDLRYIMRRIFERAGHLVLDASHGVAALESVHRSVPDLLVTDMMMPIMGGAELIRRLRADPLTVRLPILAATGDAHLACGADAVLAKPWKTQQLLEVTNTLLAQKAAHI